MVGPALIDLAKGYELVESCRCISKSIVASPIVLQLKILFTSWSNPSSVASSYIDSSTAGKKIPYRSGLAIGIE